MSNIIFLIGLPATGKSTYLKNRGIRDNEVVVSTDDILCEYATNENLTYDEAFRLYMKAAEKEFFTRIERAVAEGKDIIVDRTNMSIAARGRVLAKIPASYSRNAVVFGTYLPVHEWLRRMGSRPGKTIPLHVLMSMASNFEFPSVTESFKYTTVIKD